MIKGCFKACALGIMAAMVCAAGGCDLMGVVADKASGGPTVKAKYDPQSKDSMLVLVESYGLSMDSGIESEHMTLSLSKALEENKIAPLVDEQKLEKLKDADPQEYHNLTIADIGRKVGARQVLYVHISRAEIEKPNGGGQMRGQMEAKVKIVDSRTADTRWPVDSTSESVQITTDWVPENAKKTESDIRAEMADQMAVNIANLFHDYHTDQEPMEKVNVD